MSSNQVIKESNEWLIKSNWLVQRYFLSLLLINIILGFMRFYFPFQVLTLNGLESSISVASALLATGQIISFLLLRHLFQTERRMFLAASIFNGMFILLIAVSDIPVLIVLARLFEGAGIGMAIPSMTWLPMVLNIQS